MKVWSAILCGALASCSSNAGANGGSGGSAHQDGDPRGENGGNGSTVRPQLVPDDPCELSGADCSQPPPNILFILMDDVGLDLVSSYERAPDAPPTVNIDRLAQEGVRFTRAYALPWCSPTRAAALTGRDAPRDFLIGRAIRAENASDVSLPLEALTLPEALDEHSPVSWGHAHIGKWHLTKLADHPQDAPLRYGYQRFRGAIANPYQRHTIDGLPQDYYDWERSVDGKIERSNEYATSRMIQDAIEVTAELPEPWFVWLAPFAAHDPHQPPPDHLHSYGDLSAADAPTLVRAMVEALDREIGRLLEALPEKVRQNTMVLIMGDNGTSGGLNTVAERGIPTKGTVYEGGVHVPLVVAGPLVKSKGRTHDGLVAVHDIFATVLDLARIRRSKRPQEAVAISFLPQLLDPAAPGERRSVIVEAFEPNGPGPYTNQQVAVFDGRYKLIINHDRNELFYDLLGQELEDVPLELGDLTPEQRVAYEALKDQLDAR